MPVTDAGAVDRESLAQFFDSHAVDEFAVVPSSAIAAPPGRRPADLLPACRTMIVFGKVMGDELFEGSVAETAPRIAAFKQHLAGISHNLSRMLEESGAAAMPVTSVAVKDGRLVGGLSFKHCAADAGLGEIGDNGLLLSPRYGIRLGLGAVLTDREIPAMTPARNPVRLCTHCGLCIRACPTRALTTDGIDSFRCLNITGALPGPVASLFERLMGVKALEEPLTRLANRVAAKSAARCSECLVACPLFRKSGGNQVPVRPEEPDG
ncbi:MAG TPA: 4Fe-4S binding protein [Methanoregulaceae archaeon]|nr:4Fe-4S binding protein [Methanoregulaceae archaeon]